MAAIVLNIIAFVRRIKAASCIISAINTHEGDTTTAGKLTYHSHRNRPVKYAIQLNFNKKIIKVKVGDYYINNSPPVEEGI
jgi:hypothetical protein